MNFSLVLIGAHNGHKTTKLVASARKRAPVLLVEPVPHLFAALEERYRKHSDILLVNKCLALHDGVVDFYAPTQEASTKNLDGYGDQLGSMEPMGYDARLLGVFPFHRLHPRQIAFEYKHSDGTFNLGRNLGSLLILLDSLDYSVRVVDPENMYAQKRGTVAA
jgi:hypothetical protein